MAPKPKAAAVKVTPAKKDLKEAFEEVHAHSSFLSAFTSRWKDLEEHVSSIERSIEEGLRALESGEQERPASSPLVTSLPSEMGNPTAEVEPRPELKSMCVSMDGKGLLAFIRDNRNDLPEIYNELNPAIRAAPDPATLVLDAIDGFYPAKRSREDTFDGGRHANGRSCIFLLERLHMISPAIKPAVRERAKKLAAEWEVKIIPDAGQYLQAVAFLQLLVSYDIASDFEEDGLLDLLVSLSKKKEAIGLCRNLGLHRRMADLVLKLSRKGKQLDAVKFVYAFDLAEKIPPVPLLKSYIKESKKFAEDLRGFGTTKSKNAAISRQLDQLRAVIKIIEEYKLESQYSPVVLQKRVTQLEQLKGQKAQRKRLAAIAAVTNAKTQQWQADKQPRPSTVTATAASVVAAQPPLPLSQTQPQYPLTVGAPYMASTGPYQQWQADKQPRPSTVTATVVAAQPPLPLSQTQPQYPITVGAPYMASTGPYLQWQADKQPRPSTVTSTAATVVAAQPRLPLSQTQPQYPLTVGAPYMASTGPYDLTGSFHPYDRTTIYKGNLLDLGPMLNPTGSLLYSEPHSGSGLYDKSGGYGSYSLSGSSVPQYNSSLYP